MDSIGSRHFYSAMAQDNSSRSVARQFLYGSSTMFPIPDIVHTDFPRSPGANTNQMHPTADVAVKDEPCLARLVSTECPWSCAVWPTRARVGAIAKTRAVRSHDRHNAYQITLSATQSLYIELVLCHTLVVSTASPHRQYTHPAG